MTQLTDSIITHSIYYRSQPHGFCFRYDAPRYEGHYSVSEGRFNTIAGHGHWHHASPRHHAGHHGHYSPTAHGHFAYPPPTGVGAAHPHTHTGHPSASMSVLPTTGTSLSGYVSNILHFISNPAHLGVTTTHPHISSPPTLSHTHASPKASCKYIHFAYVVYATPSLQKNTHCTSPMP